MNITDCHIHAMPSENYSAEIKKLISHMEQNGISQAVISDLGNNWLAYPDKDTLITANRRLQSEVKNSNGRLHYLVYINPQLPDWQEIFDEFISDACGVKLWISLRSKEHGLEKSKDVLRAAQKHRKAVLIHTFDRTSAAPAGEIGINEIIELANAVPECTIVAAHSGGNWRKAIAQKDDIPNNVCFDISGSYPERTMVSRLVSAFGADRILYGSDAFGRSFASQLSKVAFCDFNEEDLEKILYSNSKKIFNLPEPPPLSKTDKPNIPISDNKTDNFSFVGKGRYYDHDVTAYTLVNEAEKCGITKIFAASLTALTEENKTVLNQKHLLECKKHSIIHPLAAVDLNNMPEALKQLENIDDFAGVIISPYLHNYPLEYDRFAEFFDICSKNAIPLWINTSIGDDRFRSADLMSRCVNSDEIIVFTSAAPYNTYIFQGCGDLVKLSRALPEHCKLECSKLSDHEYLPEDLLKNGNIDRLVFGTEYPFREYSAVKDILNGKKFFS